MSLKINSAVSVVLESLYNTPRVPLPAGIPDDEHNRVMGLVQMITERFPVDAVVMELGSGMGVSTEVFALLCKKVHTTDTWGPGLENWREAFDVVFKRYMNISQYFRKSSVCAHLFEDNYFDAVYLDTDHSEKNVTEEIKTWYSKVKIGGYICGHDYVKRAGMDFGVIEAVDKIFGKPDTVYPDTSWIVKKCPGGNIPHVL